MTRYWFPWTDLSWPRGQLLTFRPSPPLIGPRSFCWSGPVEYPYQKARCHMAWSLAVRDEFFEEPLLAFFSRHAPDAEVADCIFGLHWLIPSLSGTDLGPRLPAHALGLYVYVDL